MRRRWVFLAPLAVIVVLGVIGGTVMAQESGEGDGSETRKDVLARVAAKLDVDEAQLRTAFSEARAEVRDERIKARIDALVAAGRLTAEEGEELKTWYDSRPAVADIGRGGRYGFDRGFRRGGRGHGAWHRPQGSDPPEATATPEGTTSS